MKTVVSPDMVAHLWANQSQDNATNSGRTFYFTGDTIYSYGSHFPIARHVTHKGKKAILMTTGRYSVTTSSHISMVRQAIKSGATIFHVPHVVGNHADNLKYFADRIKDATAKADKAARPHKAGHRQEAVSTAASGNAYAAFFGLKTKFKADAPTEQEQAACKAWERARDAKRQAKQEKADALRRLSYQEKIGLWLSGDDVPLPYLHSEQTRLRIKNGIVQTTRGAEVPLDHALKLLPLIRAGKAWHRNGQEIRIGSFFMDSISENGDIVAGCHTIKREEMERLAATIGQ